MGLDGMSAAVTFITASYAKGIFLAEAGYSVFSQTRPDWEWWIVLNGPNLETEAVAIRLADMDSRVKLFYYPASEEERYKIYYPAAIANEYYPKVQTPYFTWLSDDDILEPCFIEALAGALEADPNKDVVFGTLEGVRLDGGRSYTTGWILARNPIGRGTHVSPDCVIDSGQILQTKRSYDALKGWQIPIGWDTAHHVDGIYMDKVARKFTFWPVGVKVITHRRSKIATFGKS
jgi:hypothetical protein